MTIAINSKYFDNYKRGVMSPAAAKCKSTANSLDHQVSGLQVQPVRAVLKILKIHTLLDLR
jgi:hypothetical protein